MSLQVKEEPRNEHINPIAKREYAIHQEEVEEDEPDLDLTHAGDTVWLVKLPKFLFDKWSTSPAGTELGQLKVNEANRKEMKVVVTQPEDSKEDAASAFSDIPLEYALDMQNSQVRNTFIFSEPPAKPWPNRRQRSVTPAGSDTEMAGTEGKPETRKAGGPNRSRRNLGGQKLSGKVVHDCLVKPIDNAHYRSLLRNRVKSADVPKRRVETIEDLNGSLMQPGTMGGKVLTGGLKTFIKSKSRLNKSRDVNARMSLDNLIDEISKCFQQYEYWSLKAFKAHLKQPESYLKETLDSIATLHKRGPMTGKWQLKAETRNAMKGYAGLSQFDHMKTATSDGAGDEKIKSEHAGEAAPEEGLDSDEEDDDIEMEDRL